MTPSYTLDSILLDKINCIDNADLPKRSYLLRNDFFKDYKIAMLFKDYAKISFSVIERCS